MKKRFSRPLRKTYIQEDLLRLWAQILVRRLGCFVCRAAEQSLSGHIRGGLFVVGMGEKQGEQMHEIPQNLHIPVTTKGEHAYGFGVIRNIFVKKIRKKQKKY